MSNARTAKGAATAPAVENGIFKLSRPLEITPGETITELKVTPVTVSMMRRIRKAPFTIIRTDKGFVPDFDFDLTIRYMAAMTGIEEAVLNGLSPADVFAFTPVLIENFNLGAST